MSLPPADILAGRHRSLARALAAAAVDALLVTHRPNIAYLTGFFGTAGMLVTLADRLVLLSDGRYAGTLAALSRDVPALSVETIPPGGGSVQDSLVRLLGRLGVSRLGFEPDSLTVRQHQDLMARCGAADIGVEWQPLEGSIEALRVVKDAWEVDTLREAGRRLSDVAKCIIPRTLAGVAERDLAALIEWELRRAGFDKPAFDTIVAAGPNGALPHHRAGDRRIETGDLVVIDFGGMFRGYAVDMTRVVAIGAASARQRACWEAVAAAQRAAFEAARVGIDAEDVDAAARRCLAGTGMDEAFGHGLGHGLGLEVHERPRLARRRPGVPGVPLQAGMVFTLEPGVYYPGWGGVRIEDDVLAAPAGPEWLTEPVAEGQTI